MPDLTDSILDTIKGMLGVSLLDTAFDTDIIVNINGVFLTLNQLGVGPTTPFNIVDNSATWTQFSDQMALYSTVKTYIYLKVKQTFDPPSTAAVIDSFANQIRELEWRLTVQVDLNTPPIP